MQTVITLKIDPRMKKALKELADKQFISVSAAVKQAIEKHLKEHGVDWRKEKGSKL
jgi:predicted transcriptional regulator